MSSRKLLKPFVISVLGLWLTAGKAGAELPDLNAQTNAPAFRATLKSEPVVGGTNAKLMQRAYLTSGTNKFAFLVPEDFRADASQPNKVVLSSPDLGCFISVRLSAARPPEAEAVSLESWRNQALNEFPGASIAAEFSLRAADHSGPAYELQRTNASGKSESACAVFIPFAAGVLEFSLLTHSDKYADGQYFFHSLLLSVQCNENGKFVILPIPGNS